MLGLFIFVELRGLLLLQRKDGVFGVSFFLRVFHLTGFCIWARLSRRVVDFVRRLLEEDCDCPSNRPDCDDVAIDAVSNDTRNLGPGSLYVALRGERFDGHDFAADAQARGASALLVERLLPVELPQVLVADSELALAKIATGMQRDRGTEVFAITGSNGKTSVKSLLLSILQQVAQHAHKVVYANPGNRNNEIGLPLAVIDAPEDADYAVYEMGAGKPGDIAYLTDVARPRYALVNNIAPAHLERMGSLLGVAVTKGAIYAALPADGVACFIVGDNIVTSFSTLRGQHDHG